MSPRDLFGRAVSLALVALLLLAARDAPLVSAFHIALPVGPTASVRAVRRGTPREYAEPRADVSASVLPRCVDAAGSSAEESTSCPDPPAAAIDRRGALSGILVSGSSALLLPPSANAAQTAGEAIRRSAANIPGYGQADVFYPPYFRGAWRATREIAAADDMPLAALAPGTVIRYDVRFVPVDGEGPAERDVGRVVADRGYNERSYREAVRAAAEAATDGAAAAVRDARWDASNPNVLTLSFVDGSTEEIRVTKRAAEVGPDGDTIFSSEYRRVVTTAGERGVPSIRGNRVLTKWRKAGEGVVEGIEIVYADAVMGDPMGGGPMMGGVGPGSTPAATGPKVSAKSRIRLEKL